MDAVDAADGAVTVEASDVLAPIGVAHGFCGATGGVSPGCYASLNTGLKTDDSAVHIAENRRRALAALGMPEAALATARQIHGTAVVHASTPLGDTRPEADALISTQPGLAVGVLTADCAPVLLAAADGSAVAAVHAGWRGALKGVIDAALAQLAALGIPAAAVRAAVGPTIGPSSYEVSDGFEGPFLGHDPRDKDLFRPADKPGKQLFDLSGYVQRRLARAGVAAVGASDVDTRTDPRFFSNRASRAAGWPDFGRNLAAIAPVGS